MYEMAADTVQQVKDKLSIVEVVQPYVKLTKAGRFHKGLSPFTKEKTPSFFVNPERGSYYCFSTGQGGDIFTFIEKMEGVDFKGALKILAEKAGVEIVYTHGGAQKNDTRDRLREAMARAEAMYTEFNVETSPAYEYAKGRGLTAQTIADWGLGYAPDAWRVVLERLTGTGGAPGSTFTQKELLDAGLIKEADGKAGTWYDRFRNRLMFPIRDVAGRTVAFTGRALDPGDLAKYLNSPETELYKKSEILFGMDKAKDAIRTRGFAILVEGQFDLILLHQAGFTNTVALSGTALTPHHLTLIKRYADNLMLALDSDRAGLAATAKSAKVALSSGLKVKAVRMPVGKDPADIVSEEGGAQNFAKLLSDAQPVVEFFLTTFAASERDPHKLVLAVEKIILPLVAAIESPMEREHFVGVVARALSMTPDSVRAGLARVPREDLPEGAKGSAAAAGSGARTPVSAKPRAVSQRARHESALLAIAANYPTLPVAERIKKEYNRIIGAGALPPAFAESLEERALFEAGLAYGESPSEEAADELLKIFERTVVTERLTEATDQLRLAEAARDEAEIARLVDECRTLSRSLAQL